MYVCIYVFMCVHVSIYYICERYNASVQQGIVSESQKADLLQMFIYMYVCMYVCIYVFIYVFMCVYVSIYYICKRYDVLVQ
jgi:hypothetical protein